MGGSLTSNLARWPSFHPPTYSDSAALDEAHKETQKQGKNTPTSHSKDLGFENRCRDTPS